MTGWKRTIRLALAVAALAFGATAAAGQLTPLHKAVQAGDEAAVRFLLVEPVVDMNAEDSFGATPLHWAAWYGHAGVARLLREADGRLWNPWRCAYLCAGA